MSWFPSPAYPDLMIDIETLSVDPRAAIASIAAVQFNALTGEFIPDTFYEEIDHAALPPQFHVDPKTIAWWAKQPTPMPLGTTDLKTACQRLFPFMLQYAPSRIWANSPSFDLVILKHAFAYYKLDWPIPFWCERDVRTLKDLAKIPNDFLPTHGALADCFSQIRTVCDGYRALNPVTLWCVRI